MKTSAPADSSWGRSRSGQGPEETRSPTLRPPTNEVPIEVTLGIANVAGDQMRSQFTTSKSRPATNSRGSVRRTRATNASSEDVQERRTSLVAKTRRTPRKLAKRSIGYRTSKPNFKMARLLQRCGFEKPSLNRSPERGLASHDNRIWQRLNKTTSPQSRKLSWEAELRGKPTAITARSFERRLGLNHELDHKPDVRRNSVIRARR